MVSRRSPGLPNTGIRHMHPQSEKERSDGVYALPRHMQKDVQLNSSDVRQKQIHAGAV